MPARCDLLPGMGGMGEEGMGGSTDRSLSVCSSFSTEFLKSDARANPPNPCTRHRCCHDVLPRPGQTHTTSHFGRWSTRLFAAETLDLLPAAQHAGPSRETHRSRLCKTMSQPRIAVDRWPRAPPRVHLLSRSNRGVDPGLYSISARSEVASNGASPLSPISRPGATMWTSPRPLQFFHERAPCRHIGRVVFWSMLTGEAETCAPRSYLQFQDSG